MNVQIEHECKYHYFLEYYFNGMNKIDKIFPEHVDQMGLIFRIIYTRHGVS